MPNIVKIGPKTSVAVVVTVLHFAATVSEDTAPYVSHGFWQEKQMAGARPNTALPALS